MGFKKKHFINETDEQLQIWYLEENKTSKEIADLCGVPIDTVRHYFSKRGIKKNLGDIQGQRFGMLIAIERLDKNHYGYNWKCLCDCGNYTIRKTAELKYNNFIKSCGCRQKLIGESNLKWKGFKGLSGNKWQSIIFHANRRNINFNLTIEQATDNFKGFCEISGLPISFEDRNASLDRIDSNLGYQLGNIWWVHKDINRLKYTTPLNDFIYYAWRMSNNILDDVLYEPDFPAQIVYNMRSNSYRDKREKTINKEYIKEILQKQNYLCSFTGCFLDNKINIPSIDRIDNNKGYIPGNVRIILKQINMGKSNMKDDLLKFYMKNISEFNFK